MVGEVVGGICGEEGVGVQCVEDEEEQRTPRGSRCGVDCVACEVKEWGREGGEGIGDIKIEGVKVRIRKVNIWNCTKSQ